MWVVELGRAGGHTTGDKVWESFSTGERRSTGIYAQIGYFALVYYSASVPKLLFFPLVCDLMLEEWGLWGAAEKGPSKGDLTSRWERTNTTTLLAAFCLFPHTR